MNGVRRDSTQGAQRDSTQSAPRDPSHGAPRPAATLILLREGAAGPEVFLLQRSHRASFVAGAHVFPGGSIDELDADPRVLARVRGLTDAEASARLGVERGGLAYWIAAVRECFEEGGILLAHEERGAPLEGARLAALDAWRARLNAGELSFADLLERERLVIPAGELAYYAHWITAPGRARRFDTRFFVALAPGGQGGSHDNAETIRHAWLTPREALERSARGEIELVFATQRTIEDLARFARREEAFAYAASLAEIETNRACWAVGPDGAQQLFRRLDAPYFEIHWSDPEETGATRFDIVPGMAKRLDRLVTRVTAPNPGMMTGHGTNSYLVGEDELAVVDPGPAIESHVAAILAAANGRRIRSILCTHTHLDHSPAAAALAAATGAELIGRPAPAHPGQDASFAPARVLEHGERVRVGGATLRAVHTPGHASNHLCYMLEETRMLFTGDHVMQGSTVIINPPDGDMRAYLDSLGKLLDEDIAILAPGHGYLIGAPHKEMKRLIAHRLGREAKIGRALAQLGEASLDELLAPVYDDVPARLHAAAARSLAAHLAKLLADGRVRERAGRYRLST
jgi:glyoxylase-like metal-dependent hydrolase (beta-lactamase superfamily II)/8-oxo-dGTP pyrophosphatase MutT (NUDIX family)